MESPVQYGAIIMGLGGGLALFLYGLRKMTDALKVVAGEGMKSLLATLTRNRFTAALAGAIMTAVLQSSSMTTVLLVGFITAGMMSFTQSVGVILGANLGTTITAQIIAFKVTEFSLLMIAAGFFMDVGASKEKTRLYGVTLMGLGLMFFGLELMSQSTSPLRAFEPFITLMRNLQQPLLAILLGAVITAVLQSSSVTTGLVIVLASDGFLTLEAGIALVLGANIGTCVTAQLAAIGKPREAVQAATTHIIVNILGVLMWVAFIPQFAALVREVSPSAEALSGAARLAADVPRQVANAHTLFNAVNLAVFIWLGGPRARLVDRLVPLRPQPEQAPRIVPEYLEAYYLEQPAIALDRVKLELERLTRIALEIVRSALPMVLTGSRVAIDVLRQRDEEIDILHAAIITYLGQLSTRTLVEPQPKRLYAYIAAANAIENIGDVVETNLASSAEQRLTVRVAISVETAGRLSELHDAVCQAGELALQAFSETDASKAHEVEESKRSFNRLADHARNHIARRLIAEEPHRLATYRIESDVIDSMKRLHTFFRRLARVTTELDDSGSRASVESDERPQSGVAGETGRV